MLNSLIPWKKKANTNGGALAILNGQTPLHFRQEVNRIFDRYFGDLTSLWNNIKEEPLWGMDVEEKDDTIVVKIEAPGFDLKDFELKLCGNELVLRGEHKVESKGKDRSEERESSLYRSVTLPQGVLADKIDAKYQNGLLTVCVPKSEAGKGRRIAIKGS